jgi:hypothetical protein
MKQGIFEYVNLKKEVAKSKEGRDYVKYVVVSDVKGETNKVKDKLKDLGFHPYKPNKYSWEGFYWFIYGNELNHKILNGLKEINAELQAGGGQTEDLDSFVNDLEQLKADIQNSDASPETKQKLDSLLDQFIDDLINATDERAADALIQEYLDFSHKFRQYSFWNSILIYIQDPKATKVMGEKQWEKAFNRKVVDLNKKITINCYNRYYRHPDTGKVTLYTMDQQQKDRDFEKKTKAGEIPFNQKELDAIAARKKEVKVRYNQFRECDVFDVANTTGDPLPEEPAWMGVSDSNAEAIALFNIAKKSLEKLGVNVTQDPAMGGEGGFSTLGRINVSQGMEGSGAASIIFHEWAHDLLHQKNGKYYSRTMEYFEKKGDLTYGQIKQIKEMQAETTSYLLCRYYKLPTGNHPTYLALWQAQGKLSNKQLIKENMAMITDVSNFIIGEIEKNRGEFDSIKAQAQQQTQQPQA